MKKKWSRSIALAVAALTLAGTLSGCGNSSGKTDGNQKIEQIVWIMPGTENQTWRNFINNDLNPKLRKEIGAELSITFSPWSEWENKINLTISSGQRLDIAWHGPQGVQNWTAKKMIMPLNTLLSKYGKDLEKANPTATWKHVTYNGQIMAIPTNTPTSENLGTLCVRQDLLQKVGMSALKTIDDVTEFATKLKQQNLSTNPFVITSDKPYLRSQSGNLTMDNSLLTNWVYVDDSKSDDKIYDYFESDAYKQLCYQKRKWNQAGLIPSDYLTNIDETGRMNSGKSAIWTGAISRDIEQQPALQKNVPTGTYEEYLLYSDKPKYKVTGGFNCFVIPSTSGAPAKTIEFLNWVNKNQEDYDYLVLGVKGRDYTLDSNGSYKLLTSDSMFYEWMFRNVNYMRFDQSVSTATVQRYKNWDKDAKYSKLYGFNFDQTSVTSQIARVQSVITEYFDPMTYGFVDYDSNYKNALKELKAAGIDDIMSALQSQFSKYYASNHKS